MADEGELEIVMTRVFDAPRELVFAAFTEARHLEQWWGPEGFGTRVEKCEARVGGETRYVMVSGDGTEYPAEGVYLEFEPPLRFVTTDEFGDDYKGKVDDDLPTGTVLTAVFEALDEKTRLTLTLRHQNVAYRRKHEDMGVVAGWNSSFDCLDRYLEETKHE